MYDVPSTSNFIANKTKKKEFQPAWWVTERNQPFKPVWWSKGNVAANFKSDSKFDHWK